MSQALVVPLWNQYAHLKHHNRPCYNF